LKVIIQIPCFNEADSLPKTLADLPYSLPGVDTLETLIIDDGSSDGTADIARQHGVDHMITHKRNKGLARAFESGLDAGLALGADIIVNTDADNQYRGADITSLVAPILAGKADIVIGDRQTNNIKHFSPLKRVLQRLGTTVVRRLSGVDINDAVSGFRAYSREAALNCTVTSSFSYTIETIMQAGRNNLAVASVPIGTNPVERPSRLASGMFTFVGAQAVTIIRIYAMYQPLKFFAGIGALFLLAGSIPIGRFLLAFMQSGEAGYVQSLILGSTLTLIGVIFGALGLLGDLIARSRLYQERILAALKRQRYDQPQGTDHD